MDELIIKGPAKLEGVVAISKSKNSYLPILAASLLSSGLVKLNELPNLVDIQSKLFLLEKLGAQITRGKKNVIIDCSSINSFEANYELVKTMRASILVLGPLLARFGRARIALPGGCAIGSRPINLHLKFLEKMGATINLNHGYVEAKTSGLVETFVAINFDGRTKIQFSPTSRDAPISLATLMTASK